MNGRLESVNFNMHNAMFYPNSYLNFNKDGYYTKHYYNGMERIASRLGEQNLSINVNDPELQDRKEWQDSLIRKNITEITGYEFLPVGEEQNPEDPKPIYELPVIGISNLQPSADGIYYYHPNHLGSTCYVTDENASVVQGFLYAPFGEITTEYNSSFGSSVLPKYSFNAKELDEETGMYYYEARYYAPPIFTSRDVLFEDKHWLTPYHYCSNNPVVRVDPSGMLDDWVEKADGTIYWDENATSQETTKKGETYKGKEGYEIDGETGQMLHYKPDGTKEHFTKELKSITVISNGETYMTNNRSYTNRNRTGYYWNEKDLKVWDKIKNSNSPIGRYVNAQVKIGKFEVLSAENYWDKYGYTLGHMIIMRDFIKIATILLPGVDGVQSVNFGNFRGGVSSVKNASETHIPTFNEYRSANKGCFSGYKGRGTNTAEAWKAYKAKYGDKATFK